MIGYTIAHIPDDRAGECMNFMMRVHEFNRMMQILRSRPRKGRVSHMNRTTRLPGGITTSVPVPGISSALSSVIKSTLVNVAIGNSDASAKTEGLWIVNGPVLSQKVGSMQFVGQMRTVVNAGKRARLTQCTTGNFITFVTSDRIDGSVR
jgi:hypothetical protein